jgi:hypothetical protein
MRKLVYLALVLFMADFGCYSDSQAKRDKLPRVEVSFGKNISLFKAKKWPTYTDGRLFETTLIQEPCELVIHLPSGKDLNFEVRNADLQQENSIINNIKIRMPVEPLDYQEAIKRLDEQYSRLTKTRDPDFSKAVEEWKKRVPTPGWPETHMTRVHLEEHVELELGIQSVKHKGVDKWEFFLTFYQSKP